jgi:hypothetical protein
MNYMSQHQTETTGETNNYEANFIGAIVGLDIGNNYIYKKFEHVWGEIEDGIEDLLSDTDTIKELTAANLYKHVSQVVTETEGLGINIAVNVLAHHEILPEDLMSAILDHYNPASESEVGTPASQVLSKRRGNLLAVQDYIEERQTLIDNIEAGDFLSFSDADVFQVDLRNMGRAFRYAEFTALNPACYAFVACKTSFEAAMQLAFAFVDASLADPASQTPYAVPLIVGALAGAYHGIDAIPDEWKKQSPNYDRIVDIAKRLHTIARTR